MPSSLSSFVISFPGLPWMCKHAPLSREELAVDMNKTWGPAHAGVHAKAGLERRTADGLHIKRAWEYS